MYVKSPAKHPCHVWEPHVHICWSILIALYNKKHNWNPPGLDGSEKQLHFIEFVHKTRAVGFFVSLSTKPTGLQDWMIKQTPSFCPLVSPVKHKYLHTPDINLCLFVVVFFINFFCWKLYEHLLKRCCLEGSLCCS